MKKIKKKFYCVFCGKILRNQQRKYCSNSCKCKNFYKIHPDKCNLWRKTHKSPHVEHLCLTCGAKCGRKRYCGERCKPIKIPSKPYWKDLERINAKCKICLGTIMFPHVHHINGNNSDNRGENLLIICPSCHSRIHNFKYKIYPLKNGKQREVEEKLSKYRKLLKEHTS